jgi:hypothetical protein
MLDDRKLGQSSSERLKNIEEQISWYNQILIPFDRGERLPMATELPPWPSLARCVCYVTAPAPESCGTARAAALGRTSPFRSEAGKV